MFKSYFLATCLSVIALGVALIGLTLPQAPSQGQNVVQAAETYIKDLATQNSLRIDKEQVVAVRENGDDAVVLVKVTYTPYFQPGPGAPRLYGPQQTVTLTVHLHKSSWNAGYAELHQ